LRGVREEQFKETPVPTSPGRPRRLPRWCGALTRRSPRERLAGTLAAVAEGVDAGAHMLRIHDVRDVADFLAVRGVLRGERAVPDELVLARELRHERPG
jgi:dihydropteroate synthase